MTSILMNIFYCFSSGFMSSSIEEVSFSLLYLIFFVAPFILYTGKGDQPRDLPRPFQLFYTLLALNGGIQYRA